MKGLFVVLAALVAMSTGLPRKDLGLDLDKTSAELQLGSSLMMESLLQKKSLNKNRMYDGKLASDHQFPYMAAIRIANTNRFCGGSILSKRWILTAGHCVHRHESWTVILGSNTWQTGDDRVTMLGVEGHLHPGFAGRPGRGTDIGVIKLSSDINFTKHIQKIKLQDRDDADEDLEGDDVRVSGWGYTSSSGAGNTVQNKLRYEDLKVITNEQCATIIRPIHSYHVCTAGEDESGNHKGICPGDSGSPLVLLEGKKNGRQVGIVSFSAGGCGSRVPSVFTRTAKFLDWISNTTGIDLP